LSTCLSYSSTLCLLICFYLFPTMHSFPFHYNFLEKRKAHVFLVWYISFHFIIILHIIFIHSSIHFPVPMFPLFSSFHALFLLLCCLHIGISSQPLHVHHLRVGLVPADPPVAHWVTALVQLVAVCFIAAAPEKGEITWLFPILTFIH